MTPHRPAPTHRRRGRLRLGAAALAVTATVLLVELLPPSASRSVTNPPSATPTPTPTAALSSRVGPGRRDEMAAEPMLPVEPVDARPTTVVGQTAPVVEVPPARLVGPAGVPSGFPQTPEGAVGQLAALEVTVLETMSRPRTADLYRLWALPGGVGADRWTLTAHVDAFLTSAGMGAELQPTATVTAVPAAGVVKGSDGPGWVLACVLLEVHATITVEARMGYGHCERMQWHDHPPWQGNPPSPTGSEPSGRGRWMIAAGAAPAAAPSTWPGSEASRRAGWRRWADAPGPGPIGGPR